MKNDAIWADLISDYSNRIQNAFPDDEPIVMLYGSCTENIVSSDFDVCVILHHYDEMIAQKISDITVSFHEDHRMKLDDEVPFSVKTVYSYFDIERLLLKPPYPVVRCRFKINPIIKTQEFLSSDEVKLRLLMYVLTANSQCILGNRKIIERYSTKAWKTLIRVVYSYTGNEFLSKNEFLECLYANPFGEEEGEAYLGYKRSYKNLRKHLTSTICEMFEELVNDGSMEFSDGKYLVSTSWLNELCLTAISNNIGISALRLKEYEKMDGYDFSENANPFGPTLPVQNAIRQTSMYINVYPDHKNIDINTDMASFFDVSFDNVAVCNGSLEAIYAFPRILDASNAVVVVPTYWGYAAGLEAVDKKCSRIHLTDELDFDLDSINEAAKSATMMFICNPNNPTSSYIFKKDLLPLIKANKNCHFIVDESHLLLHDNFFDETLSKYVQELDNLSLVYSLSKLFAVAGLRVGTMISNKDVVNKFKKWQIPYSLNTPAQAIFPVCLADKKFVEMTRSQIHKLVREFSQDLSQFDFLQVKPSLTNFVLCKITGNITAVELANKLQADGIYIRELTTSYPDIKGEWIRISVNTKDLNSRLIRALKSYNIK